MVVVVEPKPFTGGGGGGGGGGGENELPDTTIPHSMMFVLMCSKHTTLNPKPQTPNPKPQTLNPNQTIAY